MVMQARIGVTRDGGSRLLRTFVLAIGLLAGPALAEDAPPADAAAANPDPLAECLATSKSGRKQTTDDEFCLMRLEHLGALSIGIGEKDALAALNCPVSRGKDLFSEATGDYTQKWSFPACGVDLTMTASSKRGPKVVTSIVVAAPSTLATSKGIHIGSTEDEVLTAYGPFLDRGASRRGKTVVAGSIYGGLIVSIADGKVSEIFLGAAAE